MRTHRKLLEAGSEYDSVLPVASSWEHKYIYIQQQTQICQIWPHMCVWQIRATNSQDPLQFFIYFVSVITVQGLTISLKNLCINGSMPEQVYGVTAGHVL